MSTKNNSEGETAEKIYSETLIIPNFVLLFSISLPKKFTGFGSLPSNVEKLDEAYIKAWDEKREKTEVHLLGKTYMESGRVVRWPLGRIALNYKKTADLAPKYADVYLLTHSAEVATWEVWLHGSEQPFNHKDWIDILNPQEERGIIAELWETLGALSMKISGTSNYIQYFPISIVRTKDHSIESIKKEHAQAIIQLLLRDRASVPFKEDFVTREIGQDYCARENGLTLLSRRSGFDLHNSYEDSVIDGLPPQDALPFIITIELLVLEYAVLHNIYEHLSKNIPASIEEMLQLKQKTMDGLEEYYGTTTVATRFSDEVSADGEILFGIKDLYSAVMDRFDAISFDITTRYQKHMASLEFWLVVVFGATEIGFIASGIATWYYQYSLVAVVAWTVGVTAVSAITLIALLWKRVK